MAVQTRGTFTELYDNVDKAVFTLLFDAGKEIPNKWRKLYNVKDSSKKFERVMSVTGVGDIPEKGEGAPYTSQVIRPGWTKDYLHTEFGAMFEVTKTAMEDDQYDQLSQNARWFMFASRVVEEKRAALLFNNGFTTEQSPDGVSIFNTAHVLKAGGTARNTLATQADLSATSLEQALIDIQTETKVEAGQLMDTADSFILAVPPALEFQATRIINSTLRPGGADNDVNALKTERRWQVLVNNYFSDADAWFILPASKKMHGLCSYTRVAIHMEEPMTDPRTRNRLYPVRWRRSFGCSFWQGLFGSSGV